MSRDRDEARLYCLDQVHPPPEEKTMMTVGIFLVILGS